MTWVPFQDNNLRATLKLHTDMNKAQIDSCVALPRLPSMARIAKDSVEIIDVWLFEDPDGDLIIRFTGCVGEVLVNKRDDKNIKITPRR